MANLATGPCIKDESRNDVKVHINECMSACQCVCLLHWTGKRQTVPTASFFPLYPKGINEQNKRKHIRPLPVSMLCLFQKVVRLWGGITESRTRFLVCKTRREGGPKLSSAFLEFVFFQRELEVKVNTRWSGDTAYLKELKKDSARTHTVIIVLRVCVQMIMHLPEPQRRGREWQISLPLTVIASGLCVGLITRELAN